MNNRCIQTTYIHQLKTNRGCLSTRKRIHLWTSRSFPAEPSTEPWASIHRWWRLTFWRTNSEMRPCYPENRLRRCFKAKDEMRHLYYRIVFSQDISSHIYILMTSEICTLTKCFEIQSPRRCINDNDNPFTWHPLTVYGCCHWLPTGRTERIGRNPKEDYRSEPQQTSDILGTKRCHPSWYKWQIRTRNR